MTRETCWTSIPRAWRQDTTPVRLRPPHNRPLIKCCSLISNRLPLEGSPLWRTSPDLPKGPSAGSRQDGGRSEDVFGGQRSAGVLTRRSVVINTLLEPDRNSLMITSRSFWSMSPCCQGWGEGSVSGCPVGRDNTRAAARSLPERRR